MISLIVGALFLIAGLMAVGYAIHCFVTTRRLGDPYPPEAAGVAEHYQRTGIALAPEHPADCAEPCCWETRLDELVNDYDWHWAEHEMRSKR